MSQDYLTGLLDSSRQVMPAATIPGPELSETSMPSILIAHPGRQHSHQAALALQHEGYLGCYATGVPVSKKQFGAVWGGIVARFSAYEEIDIPASRTKINLLAPIV